MLKTVVLRPQHLNRLGDGRSVAPEGAVIGHREDSRFIDDDGRRPVYIFRMYSECHGVDAEARAGSATIVDEMRPPPTLPIIQIRHGLRIPIIGFRFDAGHHTATIFVVTLDSCDRCSHFVELAASLDEVEELMVANWTPIGKHIKKNDRAMA